MKCGLGRNVLMKLGHQVKGGDLLCYHETPTWNAVCSSGIHNIKHGSIGTNPKKGHENGWKTSPIQKS